MNRHHRGRPLPIAIVHVRQGKRAVPVVGVDDFRHEGRDESKADIGGDARQRGKAQRVVRPIDSVSPDIRVAGTGEQMRRVENEKAEFERCRPQQPRLCAKESAADESRHRPARANSSRWDIPARWCGTSTPSDLRVIGRAPVTSASSPTLIKGYISEAIESTRRDFIIQPVDQRLRVTQTELSRLTNARIIALDVVDIESGTRWRWRQAWLRRKRLVSSPDEQAPLPFVTAGASTATLAGRVVGHAAGHVDGFIISSLLTVQQCAQFVLHEVVVQQVVSQ